MFLDSLTLLLSKNYELKLMPQEDMPGGEIVQTQLFQNESDTPFKFYV